MKSSTTCNIAIYPPSEICKKAIKISNNLKNLGGVFTLGDKSFYPHITLYMLELPTKNIDRVKELLAEIASKVKPVAMTMIAMDQGKTGYVGAGFAVTDELRELQKRIVRAINPLREGLTYHSRDYPYSAEEMENLATYGYDGVFEAFNPHLNFTLLSEDKRGINIKMDVPSEDFSFTAQSIGFFILGDNYTCQTLISESKLSV